LCCGIAGLLHVARSVFRDRDAVGGTAWWWQHQHKQQALCSLLLHPELPGECDNQQKNNNNKRNKRRESGSANFNFQNLTSKNSGKKLFSLFAINNLSFLII
jgi:hypothetical protein